MYNVFFMFSVEPVVDIGITWMRKLQKATEAKRIEQQQQIELDALTTKRKKIASALLCDADKKAG